MVPAIDHEQEQVYIDGAPLIEYGGQFDRRDQTRKPDTKTNTARFWHYTFDVRNDRTHD
jgi:hypothetical protein